MSKHTIEFELDLTADNEDATKAIVRHIAGLGAKAMNTQGTDSPIVGGFASTCSPGRVVQKTGPRVKK